MNSIFVIPNLSLNSGGARAAGFRQGDLDGACGPYAVMTALVAAGLLTRQAVSDLYDESPDRRTAFAKAWKGIPALVQDGTHADHLAALVLGIAKTLKIEEKLSPKLLDTSARHLIAEVVERLQNTQMPIIVRLAWQGNGAHWAVVVGYSKSGFDDRPSHLLLLDPGHDSSRIQLWNAILSTVPRSGSKPYKYEVNDGIDDEKYCQVTDGVVLR